VLPQGADQMKKARLIQPNLLLPAPADATCSSRLATCNSVLPQMGTIGVSRKPQARPERGGQPHLRIEQPELTHPRLPNHLIAHQTRTAKAEALFFEVRIY